MYPLQKSHGQDDDDDDDDDNRNKILLVRNNEERVRSRLPKKQLQMFFFDALLSFAFAGICLCSEIRRSVSMDLGSCECEAHYYLHIRFSGFRVFGISFAIEFGIRWSTLYMMYVCVFFSVRLFVCMRMDGKEWK